MPGCPATAPLGARGPARWAPGALLTRARAPGGTWERDRGEARPSAPVRPGGASRERAPRARPRPRGRRRDALQSSQRRAHSVQLHGPQGARRGPVFPEGAPLPAVRRPRSRARRGAESWSRPAHPSRRPQLPTFRDPQVAETPARREREGPPSQPCRAPGAGLTPARPLPPSRGGYPPGTPPKPQPPQWGPSSPTFPHLKPKPRAPSAAGGLSSPTLLGRDAQLSSASQVAPCDLRGPMAWRGGDVTSGGERCRTCWKPLGPATRGPRG